MTTKRPDMESFRKKALSDLAVRAEYEALDTYYKIQRQLIAMRLEFRKACASIIADPLFDTVLEISSCSTSDSARQEHLRHAIGILKKNIQEAMVQYLNQKGAMNEDDFDDLCVELQSRKSHSVSGARAHHKKTEKFESTESL